MIIRNYAYCPSCGYEKPKTVITRRIAQRCNPLRRRRCSDAKRTCLPHDPSTDCQRTTRRPHGSRNDVRRKATGWYLLQTATRKVRAQRSVGCGRSCTRTRPARLIERGHGEGASSKKFFESGRYRGRNLLGNGLAPVWSQTTRSKDSESSTTLTIPPAQHPSLLGFQTTGGNLCTLIGVYLSAKFAHGLFHTPRPIKGRLALQGALKRRGCLLYSFPELLPLLTLQAGAGAVVTHRVT